MLGVSCLFQLQWTTIVIVCIHVTLCVYKLIMLSQVFLLLVTGGPGPHHDGTEGAGHVRRRLADPHGLLEAGQSLDQAVSSLARRPPYGGIDSTFNLWMDFIHSEKNSHGVHGHCMYICILMYAS